MDKCTNWAILAHFWASENFPKKFGSISFEYLWSLNFMQNIIIKSNKPILKKNAVTKMDVRMDEYMYGHIKFTGPSQSVGPASSVRCP